MADIGGVPSSSAATSASSGPDQYCLKWNDFQANITSTFADIREAEALLDVTLVCSASTKSNSGKVVRRHRELKAHKLVLSACSPLFRSMLMRNSHPEPMIYLHGVGFEEMAAILNFMYEGQVNVNQEDLAPFLAAAEELRVRGLSDKNAPSGEDMNQGSGSQRKRRNIDSSEAKRRRATLEEQEFAAQSQGHDQGQGEEEEEQYLEGYSVEEGYGYEEQSYAGEGEMDPEDSFEGQQTLNVKRPRLYPSTPSSQEGGGPPVPSPGEPIPPDTKQVRYRPLGGRDGRFANIVVAQTSKGWHCPRCDQISTTKGNLKVHMASGRHKLQDKPHQCIFCQKFYSTRQSLQVHVSTNHREARDKMYKAGLNGSREAKSNNSPVRAPSGHSQNETSLPLPSDLKEPFVKQEVSESSFVDAENFETDGVTELNTEDEEEGDIPRPEIELA